MDEPHQRTQSGKLRKAAKPPPVSTTKHHSQPSKIVATGIENAISIDTIDYDDEILSYMQTPTTLCNYQYKILTKIAEGYGAVEEGSVDRLWRRTWNIGAWHIGNNVSLSISVMQPNIAGCWVNITSVNKEKVQEVSDQFLSYGLPRSGCKVSGNDDKVQLQGRWSLNVVDKLIEYGTIYDHQVTISGGLNISQCKIFCWLLVGSTSKYLCTLSKDSLSIITRYIPDWCVDIDEVSAGGSISLKIRSSDSVDTANDATQLIIGSSGTLQYQGTDRYLKELPEAISIALRRIVTSPHLRLFLDSLEYREYT